MKLLSTVRLTDNQKRVIAKIAAAPTPMVAGEEISKGQNLIGARNLLMKLGIITFSDNQAAITDKGQQIAVQANVLDDSGNLTDTGQKLAASQPNGQPEQAAQDAPPAGGDDMGMGGDMGMDAGMDAGADAGGMDDIGADDPSTMPPEGQEDQQPGAPVKRPMESFDFSLLKELLG